jgi:hypothetical protein
VQPQEALAIGNRVPPLLRHGNGFAARTLGDDERGRRGPLAVLVVVDVEVRIEAEARVERKRADERAGGVAGVLQDSGDGGVLRIEHEAGVVAHAVLVRQQTGEDVRVRREGDDVVGVGVVEVDAAARQLVEERRLHAIRAGEADAVGAQRVDSDEDDVRLLTG